MMNHLRISHEHDFTDIVLDSPESQNRFTVAEYLPRNIYGI